MLAWMSWTCSALAGPSAPAEAMRGIAQTAPAGDPVASAIADLGRATAQPGFNATLRGMCEPALADAGRARAAGRAASRIALARDPRALRVGGRQRRVVLPRGPALRTADHGGRRPVLPRSR